MMRGNDKTDTARLFELTDIRVAFALLTRLPLPYPQMNRGRPMAMAAWAYPLVGSVVGLFSIATIWAATLVGLPPSVAALLGLLMGVMITGAMHEDGLADCADGFWGGWTTERRLEIMKDSQIGTYGVLALLISFGLRWQLVTVLIELDAVGALLAASVASRSAMVWMMHHVPNSRATGLSKQTGKPSRTAALSAVGLGVTALAALVTAQAFVSILFAGASAYALSKLARSKIGGQTGDVLGATQQICEIVILLSVTALVHIP